MSKKYSTKEVIDIFKIVHGDRYDYSKYEYPKRKELKATVICKKHGDFQISREHHQRGIGCPTCSGVPVGGWKRKTQEEFIKELKESYNKYDVYNFSQFVYKNRQTKGKIICPKHGEFFLTPSKLLHRGDGCPTCGGKTRLNNKIFIERMESIHGKGHYDYSKFNFVDTKTKGIISCPIHGEWEARPDNLMYGKHRCPQCACINSKMEKEVFDHVNKFEPDLLFGKRGIIGKLQLDIYSQSRNIAVEFNGLYFHSEITGGKDKKYHLNKTNLCEEKGIELIHIFENEWIDPIKRNIWESILKYKFGYVENKIHARKCEIRSVTSFDSATFLTENHLQGNVKASIRLGLYYDNVLVSLLTLSKSRYDKNVEWEIIRYANLINSTTMGGFHKLMTHFIRKYTPKSIITYADKRYSQGNLYKNFGMIEQKNDALNYFYFDKHKLQLLSRHKCQKHKLKKMFKRYDENLTEWENMQLNGYDRVWDCGNKKFLWKAK